MMIILTSRDRSPVSGELPPRAPLALRGRNRRFSASPAPWNEVGAQPISGGGSKAPLEVWHTCVHPLTLTELRAPSAAPSLQA